MLHGFKVLPLRLYLPVSFHFNMSFTPFNAIFLINRYQMRKQQGVGAFHTILRQNANRQPLSYETSTHEVHSTSQKAATCPYEAFVMHASAKEL